MTSNAVSQSPTRARLWVLVLLFVAVGLNYMDRANLSLAGGAIQQSEGLSNVQLGWLLSSSTWAYLAAQIPGGWLLDRFGSQRFYGTMIVLWSIATFAMGLGGWMMLHMGISIFTVLLVCRLIMGVAQAPGMPANAKIASMWFPQQERARAIGAYSTGQYAMTALMMPVLGYLMALYGWPSVFYLCGGVGILFGIYWLCVYRDPQNSTAANQAELDYIHKNGGFDTNAATDTGNDVTWPEVRFVMSHLKFWGICITQFTTTTILYFFLTWFVTYLEQGLHLPIAKVGVLGSLPYILAAAGVLFGGVLSDLLYKRGVSLVRSRKIPIISGLLLSSLICVCNFFENVPALVIVVLSLAFFTNAYSNQGWTAMSDILPKKMMGTVGGFFNLCGNLAGVCTPIMFGLFRDMTGNFHGAMYYLTAVALIGALSMWLLVPNLEEIDLTCMPGGH